MSTRYTWSRWNTAENSRVTSTSGGIYKVLKSGTNYVHCGTGYTVVNGAFKLTGETVRAAGSGSPSGYWVVSATSSTGGSHSQLRTGGTWTVDGSYYAINASQLYSITTETVQGSTRLGYLHAASKTAYTTGLNGTEWYNYEGTDKVDANNVQISRSGSTLTVNWSASGLIYTDAAITYNVEIQVNDAAWAVKGSTGEHTLTCLLPSDAVTVQARIGATDGTVTGDAVASNVLTIPQAGNRYVWDRGDGGTETVRVTSQDINKYPKDAEGDGYNWDYIGADTIDATAVNYPSSVRGGAAVTVTATPGTGKVYGGTVQYQYEYSLDGGETWTVAATRTVATTYAITVPSGSAYFTARVRTMDNTGYTGYTYVTGPQRTVINNVAPVITCSTTNKGTQSGAFTVGYSVSDEDGDTMTVVEKIGRQVIRTFTTTGGSYTLTVTDALLLKCLNGAGTVTILCDDGTNVVSHTVAFAKAVYTMKAKWATAKATDQIVKKVYIGGQYSIPSGATVSLKLTNDGGTHWEDATAAFLAGTPFNFSNASATNPAFNFDLTVARGSSNTGGYVDVLSFILDIGGVSAYGNTVCTLTHTKAGTAHTMAGLNGRTGVLSCTFRASGAYSSGDTLTIDGTSYTVATVSGSTAAWTADAGILAVVDTDSHKITLQI